MAGKKDKKYLEYVVEQPCMVYDGCRKHPVVPHHWRSSGEGGIGIKPDDTHTVPLCNEHHLEFHNCGVTTWGEKYFSCESPGMLQLIVYKKMFELLSEYHFLNRCKNGKR